MDRQMGEILRKQEQQEQKAYQSAEMLVDMMRSDFVNSTAVLSMLDQNAAHLPELFRLTDAPVWPFDGKSIPIRRSDQFAAAKHTLCQIPYFHSHNGCELIYVFRGCCKQRFIPADTTLVLREKQACLVHPGAIHAIERCHEQDIILKFMIPSSFFEETGSPAVSIPGTPVTVFDRCSPKVDFYMQTLLVEACTRCAFWQQAVHSYLILLFIELTRRQAKPSGELSARLNSYLSNHLRDATLSGFAASIGYSADHAGRLLRMETGKNFSHAAAVVKMQAAAELLARTDDPIETIAYTLGYTSPSGLYKQFERIYGMPPGSYRKLWNHQAT